MSDDDSVDVVVNLKDTNRLSYNSLNCLKYDINQVPSFDEPLKHINRDDLEATIASFYDLLEREVLAPTELLRVTKTDNLSFEFQLYAERRLIELAEEKKDKIVYVKVKQQEIDHLGKPYETSKIFLARESKLPRR